mmetsp:Transcript_37889/g.59902  ORF Transcript_37889/g.59902 Transcript_37889/m.59902 type:complete len:92 (+) Transcript_37889:492-767(+)
MIDFCNSLPCSSSSPELTSFLNLLEESLNENEFLAGDTFSSADACILPFLQRVESEWEGEGRKYKQLRKYMNNAHNLEGFKKTVVDDWWWW